MATLLAQLEKHHFTRQEVAGSNPGHIYYANIFL